MSLIEILTPLMTIVGTNFRGFWKANVLFPFSTRRFLPSLLLAHDEIREMTFLAMLYFWAHCNRYEIKSNKHKFLDIGSTMGRYGPINSNRVFSYTRAEHQSCVKVFETALFFLDRTVCVTTIGFD